MYHYKYSQAIEDVGWGCCCHPPTQQHNPYKSNNIPATPTHKKLIQAVEIACKPLQTQTHNHSDLGCLYKQWAVKHFTHSHKRSDDILECINENCTLIGVQYEIYTALIPYDQGVKVVYKIDNFLI